MNKKYSITAIITDKRGKVLSVGENSYKKTHPMQKKFAEKEGMAYKVFLHAEISALIKLRNPEDAHTITIIRTLKNGEPANAKPCRICAAAIKNSNIKNIVHT